MKITRTFVSVAALFLILVGCAGSSTLNAPVANDRIGMYIELDPPYHLAFSYTGFTVFNNFNKTYTLETDMKQQIVDGLTDAITKSGNTPVLITQHNPIPISSIVTIGDWDGSATLNEKGKELIKKWGSDLNIHYVFLRVQRSYSKEDGVQIYLSNEFTDNKFSKASVFSYPEVFMFDAQTGEYIGKPSAHFGDATNDVKMPKDKENISKTELESYATYMRTTTYDYVYDFLANPNRILPVRDKK